MTPNRRHLPTSNRTLRALAVRRGFTLVEMLLVLSILVVMSAMVWPRLQGMYLDQKITGAAEEVRSQLAGTRNKAIDAVLIYEFRYEPGGPRFLVVPHEPDQLLTEGAAPTETTGSTLYRAAGELPAGVRFAASTRLMGDITAPPVAPVAEWQLQGLPQAQELTGVNWSLPTLFYSDGSADTSALKIEDSHGQVMELVVRGLTGAVSATPVRQEARR